MIYKFINNQMKRGRRRRRKPLKPRKLQKRQPLKPRRSRKRRPAAKRSDEKVARKRLKMDPLRRTRLMLTLWMTMTPRSR